VKTKTKISVSEKLLKRYKNPGPAGALEMGNRRNNKKLPMTPEVRAEIVKQIQDSKEMTNTSNLTYDNKKVLENQVEGEKYLIIHRTDEGLTMKDMSPIMIETALKNATNNGKITCKMLKSGDILVKTENLRQAKQLMKLTQITNANLTVSEHKSLNTCRGVVYAYELKITKCHQSGLQQENNQQQYCQNWLGIPHIWHTPASRISDNWLFEIECSTIYSSTNEMLYMS
jgi:hypothetical protein